MKNLRQLREANMMSQQKLADQFGLAQSQIHAYENDAYEPDINTLKRFADFFETSVDYIIGNTEIPRRIEHVEKYDLNADEACLIDKYRDLSVAARKSIMMMADTFLEHKYMKP